MSAASDLNKIARRIKSVPREWVEESMKTLQQAIKPSLSRDTGGDNRLSGSGSKLNTKIKVDGDAIVTGEISGGPAKARGPWFWLEEGTRDRPQGGDSPPKRTWSRAVEPVLPRLIPDAEKRVNKAIRGT